MKLVNKRFTVSRDILCQHFSFTAKAYFNLINFSTPPILGNFTVHTCVLKGFIHLSVLYYPRFVRFCLSLVSFGIIRKTFSYKSYFINIFVNHNYKSFLLYTSASAAGVHFLLNHFFRTVSDFVDNVSPILQWVSSVGNVWNTTRFIQEKLYKNFP